jgi:hypothetical protein
MPLSFNTTPIRNSCLGYTTSMVHQSPFERVNQWNMPTVTPAFTPSPYIPLQVMTSWRSTVPLGELKSSTEGQLPFF